MGWAGSTNPGVDPTTRRRIMQRDHRRCYLCGNPAVDVDHIRSRASGGTGTDDNLAGICADCHRKKTAAESLQARGYGPLRRRPAETHPGLAH